MNERRQYRPFSGPSRPLAWILVAGCLLAGCTDLETFAASRAAAPDPGTAPSAPAAKAEPAVQPAAQPAPRAAPRSASAPIGGEEVTHMQFTITYRERLFVPAGSTLVLRLTSDAFDTPVVKTVKTRAGPPYAVSINLPAAASWPITVEATLTSLAGHVLAGQATFSAAPEGSAALVISTAK